VAEGETVYLSYCYDDLTRDYLRHPTGMRQRERESSTDTDYYTHSDVGVIEHKIKRNPTTAATASQNQMAHTLDLFSQATFQNISNLARSNNYTEAFGGGTTGSTSGFDALVHMGARHYLAGLGLYTSRMGNDPYAPFFPSGEGHFTHPDTVKPIIPVNIAPMSKYDEFPWKYFPSWNELKSDLAECCSANLPQGITKTTCTPWVATGILGLRKVVNPEFDPYACCCADWILMLSALDCPNVDKLVTNTDCYNFYCHDSNLRDCVCSLLNNSHGSPNSPYWLSLSASTKAELFGLALLSCAASEKAESEATGCHCHGSLRINFCDVWDSDLLGPCLLPENDIYLAPGICCRPNGIPQYLYNIFKNIIKPLIKRLGLQGAEGKAAILAITGGLYKLCQSLANQCQQACTNWASQDCSQLMDWISGDESKYDPDDWWGEL
jgi:hypothetical protein